MIDMENITTLPSGNLRVRVEFGGRVVSRTFEHGAHADAVRFRNAVKAEIATGDLAPAFGTSLAEIGPKFLASRRGHRDYDTDVSRWHKHIATASWARKPLSSVLRSDGLTWLDELKEKVTAYDPKKHGARVVKPLAWDTRRKCLNLARRGLAWAIDKEHFAGPNPFSDLRVEREDGDEDEGYQEGWYLDAAEQQWLLSLWDTLTCFDMRERMEKWIVASARALGLRQGEMWCLHLADVHVDGDDPHVAVRFGSWDPIKERYRPPKGRKGEKKTRRVPLWGPGLVAIKRWLELLPMYCEKNPLGLVFPTPRGKRRDKKAPRSFARVAEVFGVVPRIGRSIWWHLLRHTCASSLVSGWWGLRWSLEDVQQILGHSDIRTTQRYAHLAPSAVAETAARAHLSYVSSTGRHAAVTLRRGPSRGLGKTGRATQDSNLRPTAPEGSGPFSEADWIARRDGAVAAIERAWASVDARDPTSLRQCIAAMEIARTVLVDATPAIVAADEASA